MDKKTRIREVIEEYKKTGKDTDPNGSYTGTVYSPPPEGKRSALRDSLPSPSEVPVQDVDDL